ncbi:hypothetical protein J2853_002727 [Streptosporangium lutulentum]|uniref:Uncharacterized protein n=1 Tax=Streptosporangium lutulentum TaxID=1461250 RepID=A0ABT9QAW7_9ACTN|nr:hypothetical protein [Streptosporangium lutulentum]
MPLDAADAPKRDTTYTLVAPSKSTQQQRKVHDSR